MFRFSIFIIFFTLVFVSIIGVVPEGEYIVLNLADLVIEINSVFAAFLMILFIALVLLAAKFLYSLIELPKTIRYGSLKKNHQKLISQVETTLVSLQLGNLQEAKKQIAKLKAHHKTKLLPFVLEAQTALIEKDDKKLQASLDRILDLDPQNSFALNGKGALAFKNRNYKQSQKHLEKAFQNNKKAKNILPALIQSYFINNEYDKLSKILASSKKMLTKQEYIKEHALNSFLLAQKYFNEEKYKLAISHIETAYKLYPSYFPIFSLYVELLWHKQKYDKARKLILKKWHSYQNTALISLYEISSKNIPAKKQFAQIGKLLEKDKSNSFIPILYARIAVNLVNKQSQKQAEAALMDNPNSLKYRIALNSLVKLREALYGENSHEVEETKQNFDTLDLNYSCDNCGFTSSEIEHICPNCLELASFNETTSSEHINRLAAK